MVEAPSSRKKTFSLRWRAKLLILLVALSVAPVAVLSFSTLQALGEHFHKATLDSLQGLARSKSQAVDQFTTDRVRQVERISTLIVAEMKQIESSPEVSPEAPRAQLPDPPDVRAETTLVPEAPARSETEPSRRPVAVSARGKDLGQSSREALRKTLGLILWDQQDYEELLVIDPVGTVLVSTFSRHEGKTADDIEYFQNGLAATYVQPVFISPITQKRTMVVATPVKDENQRVIGVLAARLNLETFFRLIGDLSGQGETGETVVGRKLESEVVFMAPTRHDDLAALERKVKVGSELARPLQAAARGQVGSGEALDYRGLPVLAAWHPIPSLDWGLVVKMDASESQAVVGQARSRVLGLMLGILCVILVVAAMVSKAMVRPLRELKDAADKISKGDLDVKLQIRPGDEVGDLADSFERMVAAIKFFREDTRHIEDAAE